MSQRALTAEQVRHIARLARLAITDEEAARFEGQLGSILEYVAKIGQADAAAVEPMSHAANLLNVLRDDDAGAALPLDKVLQNAPDTDGRFFKVPKVIGGDEDSAG